MQSGDMSPEQYYPKSATIQLHTSFQDTSQRHSVPQQNIVQQQPRRGPMPKFEKIKTIQELNPKVNTQPAFRRANPEGGFISVCEMPRYIIQDQLPDCSFLHSHCKRSPPIFRQPTEFATLHSSTSPLETLAGS
jgi:hypothetical protein